jgi:hypothetical protein
MRVTVAPAVVPHAREVIEFRFFSGPHVHGQAISNQDYGTRWRSLQPLMSSAIGPTPLLPAGRGHRLGRRDDGWGARSTAFNGCVTFPLPKYIFVTVTRGQGVAIAALARRSATTLVL